MVGYDTGGFGADDGVTPAAACTVVLRYMDLPDIQWDYNTACQTALDQGLTTAEAVAKTEITRGDLAIMLYRALGNTDFEGSTVTEEPEGTISRNTDGSINLPADGSQYVPQEGDVIRCDDGTNYTITDVSRWDKNMFASGPVGELPEPTCDWSLMPQVELPAPEARHYSINDHEYLSCEISMRPDECFTRFITPLGIIQRHGRTVRPCPTQVGPKGTNLSEY